MSQFKFKTTLVRGLALGIPIAVILYVFIKILVVIEKLISPAAEAIGIRTPSGRGNTHDSLLLVLLCCSFFCLDC